MQQLVVAELGLSCCLLCWRRSGGPATDKPFIDLACLAALDTLLSQRKDDTILSFIDGPTNWVLGSCLT